MLSFFCKFPKMQPKLIQFTRGGQWHYPHTLLLTPSFLTGFRVGLSLLDPPVTFYVAGKRSFHLIVLSRFDKRESRFQLISIYDVISVDPHDPSCNRDSVLTYCTDVGGLYSYLWPKHPIVIFFQHQAKQVNAKIYSTTTLINLHGITRVKNPFFWILHSLFERSSD